MNKKVTYSLLFLGLLAMAGSALAQTTLQNPLSVDSFEALFARIIQTVGTVIAGISVIMIIVAGIMFLLSAGSPEKINKAKAALTYAIVGLVVGISATAIVSLITMSLGGS